MPKSRGKTEATVPEPVAEESVPAQADVEADEDVGQEAETQGAYPFHLEPQADDAGRGESEDATEDTAASVEEPDGGDEAEAELTPA